MVNLRRLAVAGTILALNACIAKEQELDGSSAYVRPAGWIGECIGRFGFDTPAPLNLGQARPGFYSRGNWSFYSDDEKNTLFTGSAGIASLVFVEGTSRDGASAYVGLEKGADSHFKIDVIRDGGPDEKEAERAALTTKQPWREPRSFIWRASNEFDFGIYIPSDGRSRMLHGKLSGEGSPAQAKAVVDALWPRYRPRKPGEVPADAGVCTPYGFFADPQNATERDYAFDMSFRDPRHSNLVLNLQVKTRNTQTTGDEVVAEKVDDLPTPWELEDRRSKEEKEKCRPQQGTASRGLFGCTFAGTKAIKRHRDVQYLTLAEGQRARLLVVEYYPSLHGYAEYEVTAETVGTKDSATAPRIVVRAVGIPEQTTINGMAGKKPPKIDDAVELVRTIALSMRLRPGAVNPSVPVKDSLSGVR